MSKIAVVYWSGTGNTEAMANEVAEGAKAAGAEVDVLTASEFGAVGGAYQKDSQVMVGPIVAQCAKNFCVDQLFIGADGYNPRVGFTNSDHLRAQAVRDMAEQAEHIITESEKFNQHGVVPLQLKERIDTIITDDHIPEDTKQLLLQKNKQILAVKGE